MVQIKNIGFVLLALFWISCNLPTSQSENGNDTLKVETVLPSAENTAPAKPKSGLTDILPYEVGEPIDLSPEAQLAYQAEWDRFDYLNKQMEEGIMPSTFSAEDQEFLRNFDETRSQSMSYIGTLGDSWYNGGGPYKLKASSSLPPKAPNSYYADNAHDFDLATAWIEGVKGYGVGEYIDYYFKADSPPVTEVLLYNGYVKSLKAWEDNSRIKSLRLYRNGKAFALLHLRDTRGMQKFQLGGELQSKEGDMVLRFEIEEVFQGAKYEDTGLSELEFDGTGVN